MTNEAKKQIIDKWEQTTATIMLLDTKYEDFKKEEGNVTFLKLLEQYQNLVVGIGTGIEHVLAESDRQKIIALLEQYCEGIYQLSALLEEEAEYREVIRVLKELLQLITQELNDLPVKREALFLPYKFSMWDSLESIYFAALADEDCDAYVMPIPYIEYGEGKKTGTWKYEGEEYKEIPIISYKDYDLSEHKPDMVFIHNPYDQYNTVTSVAPDYYSTELKKHCEKLIYVPYFYSGEKMPDIHVTIPTYANMDYIVVSSKKAADIMSKYVPVDKLLPLGSPKIDRMLRINEEKKMPASWKKRIGNKKAVMLNIGINGLLQNRFRTILKMRYIFDYFKQREDIVLWWRPHPLLKQTMQSMCPELLGAYVEMERAYVLENIGIYDTTADSNVAVAACDAFLGDGSSMANLFAMLGKPIFTLDGFSSKEPSKEERNQLWLGGSVQKRDGNILSFVSELNAMVTWNVETGKLDVEKQFEDSYLSFQGVIGRDLLRENGQWQFVPAKKDAPIINYDYATGNMTKQSVEGIDFTEYSNVVEREGYLILFPGRKNRWTYYNLKTGEAIHYGGYEYLQRFIQMPEEAYFYGGALILDDKAYMCSYRANFIVEFDLKERSCKLYKIGPDGIRYAGFINDTVFEPEVFYLFAWDGSKIIKWNKNTGTVDVIDKMPKGYIGLGGAFVSQYTPAWGPKIILEDKLIIFPYVANQILLVDKKSGEVSEWKLDLPYMEGQRKSSLYNRPGNYGAVITHGTDLKHTEHLLAQTSYDGSLLWIDVKTGEVKRYSCCLSDEDYKNGDYSVENYCRQMPDSFYVFVEDGLHCSLADMMDYFMSDANLQPDRQRAAALQTTENVDGTCGAKVYEAVKETLG